MKIELASVSIINSNDEFKSPFSDKVCIFSRDNSQGKTTLVRFLIYALGYNIPITSMIDKEDYEIRLELKIGGEKRLVFRHAGILTIEDADGKKHFFNVKHDNNEVIKFLFKIDNPDIQNNLLGCFYIDQEYGWSVINRGTVLGQNRFSVDKFLRGLSETDVSKKKQIKNIEKDISLYKKVLEFYNSNNKLSDYDNQIKPPDKAVSEIQDKINALTLKLNLHNKELESALKSKNDNKEWSERIDSLKITIKHGNAEPFILKKEDIVGLAEISEYTDAIIFDERKKISNLKEEIKNLSSKLTDIVGDAETAARIKIAGAKDCIKIDIWSANSNLELLKKQKKILEDSIKSEKSEIDWTARSNEILKKFS